MELTCRPPTFRIQAYMVKELTIQAPSEPNLLLSTLNARGTPSAGSSSQVSREKSSAKSGASTSSRSRAPRRVSILESSASWSQKSALPSAKRQRRRVPKSVDTGTEGAISFDLGPIGLRTALYLRVDPSADIDRLHMQERWGLSDPQLIVSVMGDTGAFGNLALDRGLELTLKRGLASVARSTNTWVFTGGCDGGVMRWAGEATSGNLGKGACIGVASWQKVRDVEYLEVHDAAGQQLGAAKYTAQGMHESSAALERHHTHFVLVDDPGRSSWGGEIDLARRLRDKLCLTLQVPLVTLVIAGGVGNLNDVLDALNCNGLGAAVVIVRNSGGCAQALAEFVELWRLRGAADDGAFSALLDEFAGRIDELLIKSSSKTSEQHTLQEKRLQVNEMLKKIVKHKRCRERLRIFAQRSSSGSKSSAAGGGGAAASKRVPVGDSDDIQHENSFDRFLLEAIVRSIALDVELREEGLVRANLKHDSRGGRRPLLANIPHENCRRDDVGATEYSVRRQRVPDHLVDWQATWEDIQAHEYCPVDFTTPAVMQASARGEPWCDPPNASAVADWVEREHIARERFDFDAEGRPLNPKGRTGLRGRGSLGRWGPNQTIDPVITREKPLEEGKEQPPEPIIQMLAARRPNGDLRWGIPGMGRPPWDGFGKKLIDAFDDVARAIESDEDKSEVDAFRRALDELKARGKEIWAGYVDDPRNTDNAWQVTRVTHFHVNLVRDPLRLSSMLDRLNENKTTNAELMWLDMDRMGELRYIDLFAGHREVCDIILHRLKPHVDARATMYYEERIAVPDDRVPWQAEHPEYAYTVYDSYHYAEFNADGVAQGDPIAGEYRQMDDATTRLFEATDHPTLRCRGTYEHVEPFDSQLQLPRNPRGRTGIGGRGMLFRWGPNHALDVVITREHPTMGDVEVLLVKRPVPAGSTPGGGLYQWALPGGFLKKPGGAAEMLKEMRVNFENKCLRAGSVAHRRSLSPELRAAPQQRSVTRRLQRSVTKSVSKALMASTAAVMSSAVTSSAAGTSSTEAAGKREGGNRRAGRNSKEPQADTNEISHKNVRLDALINDLFTTKNISELYRGCTAQRAVECEARAPSRSSPRESEPTSLPH